MFQNSQFSFPDKKSGGQVGNSSNFFTLFKPSPPKSLEDSLITTVISKKAKEYPYWRITYRGQKTTYESSVFHKETDPDYKGIPFLLWKHFSKPEN